MIAIKKTQTIGPVILPLPAGEGRGEGEPYTGLTMLRLFAIILFILSILSKFCVLAPLREMIWLKSKNLILLFFSVHPVKASPARTNLIEHF